MLAALQRLGADWPERYAPERADLGFDARRLRDWVGRLPMANTVATSRQLFDALATMNRLQLDPQTRLDALEMLRGHVAQIVAALERQLQVETLPLPPAKLQIARQAQEFEMALLLGYVESLRDFVGSHGRIPFLKTKSVTLAALRALQHASAVLVKSYLGYQAPPRGTWQEMHDIYTVAAQLKIDDKPVADPLIGAEITARSAYVQALLMALSNPYRFTQRELADLGALTLAWAPLCELREGAVGEGAFAIHTDVDRGVGYLPEERHAASAGVLSFDPTPVRRSVEGTLDMLPPGVDTAMFRLRGGTAVQASRSFIERVVKCWPGGAERGHARLSAGHNLDVVVGLHALHFMLTGGEDFDSFLRRVRGQAISLSDRESGATWTSNADQTRPTPQRAKVLDQSLGGYRLLWENGDALRMKVGELAGLASPAPEDEQQDWMVGVVRWIRTEADGSVGAGIELLARRAQPVGLSSLDEGAAGRPAMRAVLMCDDATDEEMSVLAPSVFDRASRSVELVRPADPFDWDSRDSVERLTAIEVNGASGAAFQRVIIGHRVPTSGRSDDVVAMPLSA
jgi:hypothetical protein